MARAATLPTLDAAVAAVAAGFAGFEVGLRLAALGRFLALVPAAPVPRLAELESACVTGLDGFRAPPAPEEIARRRAAGLDAVEEANLLRWGYPYVLARFRFHLTLTGPLDPAEIAPTRAALAPALAPLLAAPVPVGAICRFAEDADGRFRIVSRHALGRLSSPRRARSWRSAAGVVKRIASMPSAAAAATFGGLSSTKMQSAARRPLRSRQRR